MKKVPFLILLALCFTSLFGGIFCWTNFSNSTNYVTLADQNFEAGEANASATALVTTISSVDDLFSYITGYGPLNAQDTVELGDTGDGKDGNDPKVFDMSTLSGGRQLEHTIGNEANPFCGTFDGKGHTISNLTVDLSQSPAETVFGGLFGKLGTGAKVCNLTFHNLTIKLGQATTAYVGAVAFGENCEISNVRITGNAGTMGASLEIGDAEKVFVGGMVGYATGAKLSGLQIANDINIKLSKSSSAYVGGLVGKAEASTMNYVQISSPTSDRTLSLRLDGADQVGAFVTNLNFGGMAGEIVNCSVSDIICRINNFGGRWLFSRNDGKIHNIGGLFGSMSASSLVFGVATANMNIALNESFVGSVNLGGIAGKVSQNSNKIVNIGLKIVISTQNNSSEGTLLVGEIVGKISNPTPLSKNISFVHYSQNNGLELFGEQGQYEFGDKRNKDFLTPSGTQFDLENLKEADGGGYAYFSQQVWGNDLYGDWDFENTWYVSSNNAYLQNFFVGYAVSVTNVEGRALVFEGINDSRETSLSNLSYGQEVKLKFSFKVDNGRNMNDFFELSTLKFKGVDVARFLKQGTGYKLSGNEKYAVNMIEDGTAGFEVVIKNLTRATAGSYAITITTRKFSASISTRLYETRLDSTGKSEEVWNQDVVAPGLLQADNGTPRDVLLLSNVVYGSSYRIRTQAKDAKDGEIYAPTNEWFLIKNTESGEELQKLSDDHIQDGVLVLNFGEDDFVENLEIFAKYTSNSCTGIFTIDGGVERIELSNGNIVVENSGDRRPISKEDPKLNMDIFVKNGYEFDQKRFIDELGYKSTTANVDFCKFLNEETLEDGSKCYHFEVNMTTMNWSDFQNVFSVQVKTSEIVKEDNSWIWWVVGGVAGGIVLIMLVVLIVWLIRRRGGGGGKVKFDKKNYKQMYY